MGIKKTLKKLGRFFIALEQKDEKVIEQSILIVDNGYSWLKDLNTAIERIQDYFPKAEISVLTFGDRKNNLQKDFPAFNYIPPSQRIKPRRCRIALQMFMLRKGRYDSVILFSLDISPLIVALIFLKSKIVLYNQWGQWCSLRLRNVSEISKVTHVKQKVKFNLKNLLKRIGLFFVLLQHKDEEVLKHSILVVDNGYATFGQISRAIQRIKESLPWAKISVLALEQRRELKENFPELEIIQPDECIIRKYRIARHMIRLRNNKYDYIILLSLDITPIIASILFMDGKVLLNNQWHRWWSLKPKPMRCYLIAIPKFILNIILNIIILIYLLISVSWISLKRSFNIFRFNLLGKRI